MTDDLPDLPEMMREQGAWNRRLAEVGARLPAPGSVAVDAIRRNRIQGGGGLAVPRRVDAGRDTAFGGVPVRVFVPDAPKAVYLHCHGGGWVFGSVWEQDPMLWRIAREAQVAVVSVGYRLAPENPHPAGRDDVEAVARWLLEHGEAAFGTRVVLIGGESAGAHLATLALLRLRDTVGTAGVRAVQLSYGIYDLGMTPSQLLWEDRHVALSTPWLRWFYDQYAPGLDTAGRRHPDLSPLYADLTDLPRALFTVGAADPLVDDTLWLATAWRMAGNSTELAVWPDGPHGLNGQPTPLGRLAQRRINEFLRDCVTNPSGQT